MKIEGSLIIISAPSGTGKTSLVTSACRDLNKLQKSVSHTTRPMRVGEKDGVHYNFVTKEKFDEMLAQDIFLEHAEVFGNSYGTSRDWVTATLKQGIDVILEIDWQGAQQIRGKMPDVISIFILPPSDAILRQRLVDRKQDNACSIALRLDQAKNEVTHYNEYDYLIINDDFQLALQQLIEIISASRLRVSRQRHIWELLIDQICHKS
jgi:guanylate kinase